MDRFQSPSTAMSTPLSDARIDPPSRPVAATSQCSCDASASIKALRSQNDTIAEEPKRAGGPLLDGLDLVLNALRNVGSATQVPFMREAAGVLLQAAVRDNQDNFKRLIHHASRIVLAVAVHLSKARISTETQESLERLHNIVSQIFTLATRCTKRNWFLRTLYLRSDLQKLNAFREELVTATGIFGIDIAMIHNQYLVQLSDRFLERPAISPLSDSASGASNHPADIPETPSPIELQGSSYTDASNEVVADNMGNGTQITSGINIVTNVGSDVIMNSAISLPPSPAGAAHQRPGSPKPRRQSSSSSPSSFQNSDSVASPSELNDHLRASPCPSVADLPNGDVGQSTTQPQPQSPEPNPSHPQLSTFPLRLTPTQPHAPRGMISSKNSSVNYLRSNIRATNKGLGTQITNGVNIATNTGGNVTINSGNVTTTTIIGSNNDYTVRRRDTGRPRPRRQYG